MRLRAGRPGGLVAHPGGSGCASGTSPVLRPMICPPVTEIFRADARPRSGSEKPTTPVINAVGSIVPASARGRDGIRLRFVFSGPRSDHGGTNRQRGVAGNKKRIAGRSVLPQHLPTSPVTDARQTSSWRGTWVSFPERIRSLVASGRARKATVGHSAKTVNECVLGDTHPVARVAIAGASPAALPRPAEKGRGPEG